MKQLLRLVPISLALAFLGACNKPEPAPTPATAPSAASTNHRRLMRASSARTARTDSAGRWAIRYRFKRTRGVQRFQFRARLPREAGYPFAAGGSRRLAVRVRGL